LFPLVSNGIELRQFFKRLGEGVDVRRLRSFEFLKELNLMDQLLQVVQHVAELNDQRKGGPAHVQSVFSGKSGIRHHWHLCLEGALDAFDE